MQLAHLAATPRKLYARKCYANSSPPYPVLNRLTAFAKTKTILTIKYTNISSKVSKTKLSFENNSFTVIV